MDTHVGLNVATRVCDVYADKCCFAVLCRSWLQCSRTLRRRNACDRSVNIMTRLRFRRHMFDSWVGQQEVSSLPQRPRLLQNIHSLTQSARACEASPSLPSGAETSNVSSPSPFLKCWCRNCGRLVAPIPVSSRSFDVIHGYDSCTSLRLPLLLVAVHTIKAYRGSGGVAPLILNLGIISG